MVSDFLHLEPKNVPVICLMGPTATGKTDAAAQFTESFAAEIVSVDSSLVYRGMDIGTAKPDADFLLRYPHHLIDVRHPNETYSVANFYRDCTNAIEKITQAGKVPVLAGGTMFYFNTLEHGLSVLPTADQELRDAISQEADQTGWSKQHARLVALDPDNARRIDTMDAQRIQRGLEIVLSSGKTLAEHNANRKPPLKNPIMKIALAFSDRAILHDRIAYRFELMLDKGLEKEVNSLLNAGVDASTTAMRMIGYRQMLEYLQGDLSFNEMKLKGVAATRQLAKRQLTWLRNQSNVLWWMDQGLEDVDFHMLIEFIQESFR